MNDRLDILRVFGPIVKRIWIVGLMVLYGMWQGAQKADHMQEVWESRSTIKLNDQHSALTKFLEEIEAFSVIGKYTVELEVMRSERILRMAVERMNLPFSYYRFRKENWRDLYAHPLFEAKGELKNQAWQDQVLPLEYTSGDSLILWLPDGRQLVSQWGKSFQSDELTLTIHPLTQSLPHGRYGIQFNSIEGLMEDLGNRDDLLIRLQDEKVAMVNFYTWDAVPERAADFANALAEAYMDDFLKTKLKNARESKGFMNRAIAAAKIQLEKAELALAQFQGKETLYKLSPIVKERLEQMQEVEKKRLGLVMNNQSLKRVWRSFRADTTGADPDLVYDAVRSSPYVKGLRKLRDLQLIHTRLDKQFQGKHPDLLKLETQMRLLHNQLGRSVRNTLDANQQQLARLNRFDARFRRLLLSLPEKERKWIGLKRKVQAAEARYMALLEKQAESEIGSAADDTFHQIYEKGVVPIKRLKPFRKIKIGVHGLMYGILGAFLIHVWYLLSGRVRRKSDLQVHLEMATQAQLKLPSVLLDSPAQSFSGLALQHLLAEQATQRIGILANQRGEKAYLLAWELARTLSYFGSKVLLVDMELRRPQLSQFLGKGTAPGIVEACLEEQGVSKYFQELPEHGVDFLPAGRLQQQIPARFLHHKHFWDEMDGLRTAYDHILLLLPLMHNGDETIPILKRCDAAHLVAKQHHSQVRNLKKTETVLDLYLEGPKSLLFVQTPSLFSWERWFPSLAQKPLKV